MVISPRLLESRMRPILAAIRTAPLPHRGDEPSTPAPQRVALPFVTISRQAGVGAWSLAGRLARRLNELQPGEPPWSSFDRELVEKVAADHHLTHQLIESLEASSHSWLADFWSGLSFADKKEFPTETTVFRQVAATLRALAQIGRVVIVGRGGVYITRNMTGGVHVRLIASSAHRIATLARRENLSEKMAALKVRQLDQNRQAFCRHYWPNAADDPAVFDIILNTADLPVDALIDGIVPLLLAKTPT